ncbi:MAG: hypothetical protein QM496_03020 [Verrucomicrobiota bacterium]
MVALPSLFARFSLILPALLLIGTLPACKTTAYQHSSPAIPTTTFKSDGCSGVPDGPPSDPKRWCSACSEHDLVYWSGGSRRDRLDADLQLKTAIKESGNPLTSEIYFIGTRLGGSPYFPTPWRWGFGSI